MRDDIFYGVSKFSLGHRSCARICFRDPYLLQLNRLASGDTSSARIFCEEAKPNHTAFNICSIYFVRAFFSSLDVEAHSREAPTLVDHGPMLSSGGPQQ